MPAQPVPPTPSTPGLVEDQVEMRRYAQAIRDVGESLEWASGLEPVGARRGAILVALWDLERIRLRLRPWADAQ